VSTCKITFRSDRFLAVTSGDVAARVPYKVVVPLERIERVKPSENAEKPEQKHIRWSPRRRIRVLVHGVRELTEMLHVAFSIKTSNQ
jgi:hypothetical protein